MLCFQVLRAKEVPPGVARDKCTILQQSQLHPTGPVGTCRALLTLSDVTSVSSIWPALKGDEGSWALLPCVSG